MPYNLILLTEEISEEVSTVVEETSQVMTFTPAQIRLGILAILVVGIALYFIIRPTPEKTKNAEEFLNNLATQIMAIVLTNIEYRVNGFDGSIELSYEDFRQKILDAIYDEAWSFVEKTVQKAVEEGKLNNISSKYIKRESVESLVNIIVSRDDIQTKFKEAFDQIIKQFNDQAMKEEAADKQFAEACEQVPEEAGDKVQDEQTEAFVPTESSDDINVFDLIEPVE